MTLHKGASRRTGRRVEKKMLNENDERTFFTKVEKGKGKFRSKTVNTQNQFATKDIRVSQSGSR